MTAAPSGYTASALGTQDGAQNADVLIVGGDGSADVSEHSDVHERGELPSGVSGKYFQPHRESTQRWYRTGGGR